MHRRYGLCQSLQHHQVCWCVIICDYISLPLLLMSKLTRKILINFFLIAWLCFFTWAGVNILLSNPKQIARDKDFITNEINPNIKTIDSFKFANHRLPTVAEFHKIKHGNSDNLGNANYVKQYKDVDDDVKSYVKNIDWSDNYVLGVWRGDWWEYYISYQHKYVTNDTRQSDGFIALLEFIVIGLIPLSLWLWFNRKNIP